MVVARATFDRQLTALRDQVLALSNMVEQAIPLSMKALQRHDLSAARQVEQHDGQINTRRFEIEEQAYQLLALQQPNAKDLRLIVGAVSIVTNLERIGDHAAGIARLTIRLGAQPTVEPPIFFAEMASHAQWMVRNAMTAIVTGDLTLAKSVIDRDVTIDQLHQVVYARLIGAMTNDKALVEDATLLLWVSHNLERIGDRAVSIASRVSYLVNGDLIRHADNTAQA